MKSCLASLFLDKVTQIFCYSKSHIYSYYIPFLPSYNGGYKQIGEFISRLLMCFLQRLPLPLPKPFLPDPLGQTVWAAVNNAVGVRGSTWVGKNQGSPWG